jgi:hypothetical protein
MSGILRFHFTNVNNEISMELILYMFSLCIDNVLSLD